MDDCFQSEIVNGDLVYVCNLCDKGFYEIDKLKLHLMKTHEEEISTFAADNTEMIVNETKCEEKICRDLGSCWCEFRDKEFEQKIDEWRTAELEKIKLRKK